MSDNVPDADMKLQHALMVSVSPSSYSQLCIYPFLFMSLRLFRVYPPSGVFESGSLLPLLSSP